MKKGIKNALSILLVLVLLFGAAPLGGLAGLDFELSSLISIKASAESSGIYTYSVTDGQATITDCDSTASGAITIPSTFGEYPVTSIGYSAFSDCRGLTSVTIPDSVTSIGDYAFYDCAGLTSVSIGAGVTSIGAWAFMGCSHVTCITIPGSVTNIGENAFYSCNNLISILVNESNASFTSLDGVLFSKDLSELIRYPAGKNGYYSIPSSVISIKDSAFASCMSLTSVTIPNSVKRIGGSTFKSCVNLLSVTIESGVTYINSEVFANCSSIESVTIPNSVTSIGFHAFYGCYTLMNISIPDSVTHIGNNAFFGTAWYDNQVDGLVYIGKVAYKYKGSMPLNTSIQLRADTLGIADYAFSDDSSLASVSIPNGLIYIGYDAFSGCTSLASVTIPDSVMSIGDDAFRWCSNLIRVTIGIGVTSINDYVFLACKRLVSVTIPDSVTSIGRYAFAYCSGLTNLTIPESVTSIGNEAFTGCDNLTIFGVPGSCANTYADGWGIQFMPLTITPTAGSGCVVENGDNVIYGIEPGTTAQQLQSRYIQLAGDYTVEYSSTVMGTGTTVTVFENAAKSAGTVVAVFTIVIYGDLNGESNIDTSDAGLIIDYENFLVEWDPTQDAAYLKAADINSDGNIDTSDAGLIVDVENFMLTIDQTTGLTVPA